MSAGVTHTTRPHAFDTVGPRSGPQIIEGAVERAQDVAAERLQRVRTLVLLAAGERLHANLPVLGLLVRYQGLDMVLSCDNATIWRAHHEDTDGDGFPTGEPIVCGKGSTPIEALDACARAALRCEEQVCGG